jgi:hypothetical protein
MTTKTSMSTTNKVGLTPQQVAERIAAVDDAIANVELEGFNQNPGGINEILYAHARGDISDAERHAAIEAIVAAIQAEDKALARPR